MTERDTILALERRFWDAAGDPDFYREHFADDGRCVFGMGILDKEAVVGSMEGASEWSDAELVGAEVVALTEDVRLVIYAADATNGDGERYAANVASVYVRRDGRWLLALHTQAPAP